jgi:hypothetical protein
VHQIVFAGHRWSPSLRVLAYSVSAEVGRVEAARPGVLEAGCRRRRRGRGSCFGFLEFWHVNGAGAV